MLMRAGLGGTKRAAIAAALALFVASCGEAEPEELPAVTTTAAAPATTTTSPAETTTTAARAAPVDDYGYGGPARPTQPEEAEGGLAVAQSGLGEILVDGDGNTLYMFTPDDQGDSTCYGECADTWPPVSGDLASAGEGIDAALVGTVERDDGSTQATYNGWPLYYFAPDSAPGDTQGQGVGGVWFVLGPDGEPIR